MKNEFVADKKELKLILDKKKKNKSEILKRWNGFNLGDKIILMVTLISYLIIIVNSFFIKNHNLNEIIIMSLIYILFIIMYNEIKCIGRYFENNKLRIVITLLIDIFIMRIGDINIINDNITNYIISTMFVFIFTSFLNVLKDKKLLDNNEAVTVIMAIVLVPNLIKNQTMPIFAILLLTLGLYYMAGILIKVYKSIKIDKTLIIDIVGIIIASMSLIIQFFI